MSFLINPFPSATGYQTIEYVGGFTDAWENTSPTTMDLTSLTGGSSSAAAHGDVVLVFYAICDVTAGTPADPTLVSGGFTPLHDVLSTSDLNQAKLRGWYKVMGATPDTSVLLGPMTGDQSAGAQVRVYRNVDTDTPLDVTIQTATAQDTGQLNPPSITPTTKGAAIVSGGVATSDSDLTSALLVAELDAYASASGGHSGTGIFFGHSLNWASGAINPSTTGGSSSANDSYCAVTLALRPARSLASGEMLPSGDMDSGSDRLIPSGDMDAGGDIFIWEDYV